MARFIFDRFRFGNDLKSWRIENELTQVDVGELFGVSHGSIGGWERGYNAGILMGNFINACEWMDVNPKRYFVAVDDTDTIPF